MSGWAPSWQSQSPETKAPSEAPAGTGWEPTWKKSGLSLINNPNINPPTNVTNADLPQESMGKLVGGLASETLPVVGGTVGALAGPVGSAVGAGVGSVVRDLAQSGLQGTPAPSLGEQVGTFGKNALITGIGGKIAQTAAEAFPGTVQSRLASALATGVFGQGAKAVEGAVTGNPVDTSAPALGKDVLTNLGFDIVGGALVRKGVRGTEAGKAAEPKTLTVGEGFGKLREDVGGTPERVTKVESGIQGRAAIKDAMKGMTQIENAQRIAFKKNHLQNNTVELQQPGTSEETGLFDPQGNPIVKSEPKSVTITGPIATKEATLRAAEFAPTLSKFLNGQEFESLTPYQQQRFRQLDQMVTKLITGTPTIGPDGKPANIPILDYNTAKEMKTIISQTVGGKSARTMGEGGLVSLAKALDKDIDTSVGNWKDGQSALRDLNEMNATTATRKTVFNKEIRNRLFGKDADTGKMDARVEGDASQMFQDAYKTPEKAQRMMNALGSENHSIIKQDYLDNVLTKKGFGKAFEKFEPRQIINELEDPNSVSRTILSAPERNGILRFMRAAEASGTGPNRALNFQGNMLSLGLSKLGYVAGYAVGGPTGGQLASGAVRISTQEAFHALQEQPELGEVMGRLVKIPSSSTEAQLLTKRLMRGLAGSTVTVDVNGKEKEGTILESGKVKFE